MNDMNNGLTTKENDRELFYIGTSETDIYLQKKLGDDLKKFVTKRERFKTFLHDWQFINGWIISIGITIIGTLLANKK